MRIGAAFGAGLQDGARRQAMPAQRALVPVGPAPAAERPRAPGARPDPAVVAQLAAIAAGAPQWRRRRRADPGEAASAYGARPAGPSAPRRQILA